MRLDPGLWERAKELFEELAGQDAGIRERALAELADEEPELHAMLAPILSGGGAPEEFLATPALGSAPGLVREMAADVSGPDPAIGWRLGAYEVEERIAAGGMGAVYRARRADGQFVQRVAVKLLKRGLDTDEFVKRFRRERQLLASLDHPNIARVIEGGVAPDGRPYLVMSYIEGKPIDEHCRQHALSIPERLELFCVVCRAVHHAHQNLVVHRDLKPSNILVSEDRTPHLLDFGIAKVLEADGPADKGVTAPERRLLTPGYASPEQVLGTPVSTSSDIYSLGVILYELLTGLPPYRFSSGTGEELRRLIAETDPPAPGQTARHAEDPACRLAARALDGDLDNIVLMAMRKEPGRRYASAEHFASDIRRHLDGHPVLARPSTFRYRAGKFIRRNRLTVTAATVALLLLVGAAGAIAWQAHAAGIQRDRAVLAHEQADQISEFLASILESANPFGRSGADLTVREALEGSASRARDELADYPAVLAAVLGAVGRAYSGLGLFDEAEPLLRDAVELTRPLPEAPHELPHRLNDLAAHLHSVGRYEEAEQLTREALDSFSGAVGREGEDYALTLNNLGAILRVQGKLDEAEAALREALKTRERLFGPEDLAIAESLNNLAYVLRQQGDFEGSEDMLRRSLAIREGALGADHPLVAQAISNLAVQVHTRGDLEAAEPLYKRSLEMQRAALGLDHPDRASTLFSYGILLRTRGDSAAAEPILREAYQVRVRLFEPQDDRIVVSCVELAKCLSDLARHQEAIDLLRPVIDELPTEHRYYGYALSALIDAYEAAGMHELADELG